MKKFFTIFALFAVLFAAACGRTTYSGTDDIEDSESKADTEYVPVLDDEFVPDSDSDDNTVSDDNIVPDPCEPNPCTGLLHSTEECVIDDGTYKCLCEDDYIWYNSACILNMCDTLPCVGIENSTGECFAKGFYYECGCIENYFWFWYDSRCIPSHCQADTCSGISNSTGECIDVNPNEYACKCYKDWFWDGEKCSPVQECSATSSTPCRDFSTGLMWSSKYTDDWHLQQCYYISEGGFTDWAVPGISQLRTLIKNCPNTEMGGVCGVYNNCINEDTCGEKCEACEESDSGTYSKFGDMGVFWSSSANDGYLYRYAVDFNNGALMLYCDLFYAMSMESYYGITYVCDTYVRCNRCDEGFFWHENKCVKSPCTTDSCNIPHSDSALCFPETETTFSCWCRENYFWNGSICTRSPCADYPCRNFLHADPEWCGFKDETSFSCKCVDNYVWDDKQRKCVNSCDGNPCDEIPFAI